MSLVGVVIMKFTNVIVRVFKGITIRAERGATFGAGVTAPFVRSKYPTSLSRGSRNCRVVAASSIPQGVCSLHHGCSFRVVASSDRLTHGWRLANKEHCQEKIIVWRNTRREMLFQFPHENAGLEALHFHGEA